MRDFLAKPFPGLSPPGFPEQVSHDHAQQCEQTILKVPLAFDGILGIPHAKTIVGVAVR